MLRRVWIRAMRGRGALLACLMTAGCGGGESMCQDHDCKTIAAMTMPADTTPVVSLTNAQRGLLCDQAACRNGGYGVQRSCSNGPSVTFSASCGECLSQWPTNPACHATVHDLMSCLVAIQVSPCVSTFLTSSACDEVTQFDCLTFKPTSVSVGMLTRDRPPRP
jgi:hypothetical protein